MAKCLQPVVTAMPREPFADEPATRNVGFNVAMNRKETVFWFHWNLSNVDFC